jgi:hypothetical protein
MLQSAQFDNDEQFAGIAPIIFLFKTKNKKQKTKNKKQKTKNKKQKTKQNTQKKKKKKKPKKILGEGTKDKVHTRRIEPIGTSGICGTRSTSWDTLTRALAPATPSLACTHAAIRIVERTIQHWTYENIKESCGKKELENIQDV